MAEPTTIPDILRRSCAEHAGGIAATCAGRDQTFAELWERACRLANALAAAGLRPGDRVAMLSDNNLHTLEQVAGIALAGMVRSPLYTQNTAETNAWLVGQIGARLVIAQERFAGELRAALPADVEVVVQGEGAPGDRYEAWLADSGKDDPAVDVGLDAPHIIRFSAGTTGRPKGILHTGRGWLGMGEEIVSVLPPASPADTYLAAAPLSHAAGLFLWPFLGAGARHVLMPAFDPAGFLDRVERDRCTLTLLVPTMIAMVAAVPGAGERDLSSLRAVFYGASPITESTLRAGIGLWGPIMYQLYGQSEVLPISVLTPEQHELSGAGTRRLRSAGRPTPHTVVTIRDEDDAVLPVGEVGEVCVRTPGPWPGSGRTTRRRRPGSPRTVRSAPGTWAISTRRASSTSTTARKT